MARALDRHPDIACGDEMFLFSTPLLYEDYDRYRKWARVGFHLGVSANPYHQGRALFRNAAAYGLRRSTLLKWSQEAEAFPELALRIRDHVLARTGKKLWAEKTPRNIRAIAQFVEMFPEARVIHIVRDPRDVICSLMGRSKAAANAIESWLGSVSTIQPLAGHENVRQVRYEDLCREPERVMGELFEFLGVSADTSCLFSDEGASRELGQMEDHRSWGLTPGKGFSTKSIGRHREHDVPWDKVMGYRLTERYAGLLGTKQWTLHELAQAYGYEVEAPAQISEYHPADLRWKIGALRRFMDRRMGMQSYFPMVEGPEL